MTHIDLSGRVAFVTGGNRGIGAGAAMRLAAAGARVTVCARSIGKAQAVATAIRSAGGAADAAEADVTDYRALADAVSKVIAQHGRIDFAVANAGTIEPIARLAESDPDAWGQVVDVNLKGVYHTMRAVLGPMLASGGGTIIALNSGAANAPMEGWSHYCATKAGVQMLTRQLHKEYADRGIRSLGLSPGPVAGDMQAAIRASGLNPVSRLSDADYLAVSDAAEAIAWLCTAAADPFLGTDFSIKTEEGRRLVGLVGQSD